MDKFAANWFKVDSLLDSYNVGAIDVMDATDQLELIVNQLDADQLSDILSDFDEDEDFEYKAETIKDWLNNASHYGVK